MSLDPARIGDPHGPGYRLEVELDDGSTLSALLWLPRPAVTIRLLDGTTFERSARPDHAAAVDVSRLDPTISDDRGEPGLRCISTDYRDGTLEDVLEIFPPDVADALRSAASRTRPEEVTRP